MRDAEVLAVVAATWDAEVDAVAHLPVGFGGYHWAASAAGVPRLFVTLDVLGHRHQDLASLAAAYRSAAALDLDAVHAGLSPWVVPLAGGALSATRWLDGRRPEALDVDSTAEILDRLHAVTPPTGTPRWGPIVGTDLAADLRRRVATPWASGPHAERARTAIAEHLHDIDGWVASYHRLCGVAAERPWVVTHGEPAEHNQLVTDDGLRIIDWESLKLAPPERDLRAVGIGDPAMLDLFALEWRLEEVILGAHRFQAAHTGTADDREALAALLEELQA